MARFIHLPIYKKSFSLLVKVEEIVLSMDRRARYTTGADLRNTTRNFVVYIAKANSISDKKERLSIIERLFDLVNEIYILLGILKELKLYKTKTQYEFLLSYVFDIEKQLEGWKKFNIS